MQKWGFGLGPDPSYVAGNQSGRRPLPVLHRDTLRLSLSNNRSGACPC